MLLIYVSTKLKTFTSNNKPYKKKEKDGYFPPLKVKHEQVKIVKVSIVNKTCSSLFLSAFIVCNIAFQYPER